MENRPCILISQCIFLDKKIIKMPKIDDELRRSYCDENNSECARYIVFRELGVPKTPVDLTPGQVKEARQLIENGMIG